MTVQGIVQGVGFRPFVNRLARRHSLAGTVNNFTGGVTIEVEGLQEALQAFVAGLRSEAPPIAVIDNVQVSEVEATGQTDFVITRSEESGQGPILVSPDVAICADCAREQDDPADRRYGHPFINCTNCGPRFTIVRRVPYDRKYTSMAPFPMCPECAREYGDIDDRRYHAQPVACPQCGPRLEFARVGERCGSNPSGCRQQVRDQAALAAAQDLLAAGGIVAVKGLGGFHLACDARNDAAVRRLRQRKRREEKPFAVMVASLGVAETVARLDEEGRRLLTSPQAPVVLATKRLPEALAASVAPDSADYGLLLPYTPLHRRLFQGAAYDALVMTSGNLSDEPLCTRNEEARQRLDGIADGFLWHDREILVGCDDSVVRTTPRGPILIRRARGYVPFPVRTDREMKTILAVGGQLKNTFCITSGRNAFLSQHMGDLDDATSLEFFERSVAHLQSILQVTPEALACDLHPDYLATRYARELARERSLPLLETQHHHAHIAACLADNGYPEPVIGLACDGTGLGADGTIWGCEVLWCDRQQFRRLGHLRTVPLPGGDVAIRQPWRAALAFLWECGLQEELQWLRERLAEAVPADQWTMVVTMLERGVNCPLASSTGRLFDAVAALLGLRAIAAYEGQPPMALEAVAKKVEGAYPYDVAHASRLSQASGTEPATPPLLMDPAPTLAAVVADVKAGVAVPEIAGRFHRTFALMLADCAEQMARAEGLNHVALSGGTFQNRMLLTELCHELERRGLVPLWHRSVPPNDGGLALGQAVIADARLT